MNSALHFNSWVFTRAKQQAEGLISNRLRMAFLLIKVTKKFSDIKGKGRIVQEVKEKACVFGRLINAFISGKYKNLPWKAAVGIVAASVYFLNPADIVPDIIPVSGLLDDFTILIWTYNSLQSELDKFLKWEESKNSPV